MTHYEELGIRPNATTEEVRQAYRTVARLLHPDQQQDEDLRLAAERQMRRLNEILSTLTDAELRRSYDTELVTPRNKVLAVITVPPFVRSAPWYGGAPVGTWFWVLIGIASTGLLLWYVNTSPVNLSAGAAEVRGDPVPKDSRMEKSAPATAAVPAQDSPAGSRPASSAPAETEPQPQVEIPIAPPAAAAVPLEIPAAIPKPPPVEPLRREPPPQPLVVQHPTPQQEADYRGVWLYVPGSSLGPKLRYEPIFAEMTVREERSKLHGSYRARYRVPDEPVSSEVSFQFEGAERDGKMRWQSAGGGRGEGVLKLLHGDLLEVDWWTTVSGGRAKLTSGSIVLMRQRNR